MISRLAQLATALAVLAATAPAPAQQANDPYADLVDLLRLTQPLTGGTGQFSSYDRLGGNQDWSWWAYMRAEPRRTVLADVRGPGCVARLWVTAFDPDNARIEIYLDGAATPLLSAYMRDFFGGSLSPFVYPLAGPSSGGWVSYVPISFTRGCRIEAINAPQWNGQFYYNVTYRTYPPGDPLPESFHLPPSSSQQTRLNQFAQQWQNRGQDPKTPTGGEQTLTGSTAVAAGQTATLANFAGAGRITRLNLSLTPNGQPILDSARIRCRWDGSPAYAVDSPVGPFFGSSFGPANAHSLPAGTFSGQMYCYFAMPYLQGAVIELNNPTSTAITALNYSISYVPLSPAEVSRMRFHAVSRAERPPALNSPYTILQTTGRGHYVGCVLSIDSYSNDWAVLEGDEIMFVDGESSPSIHGTGTEDYFNGGFYFSGGPFALPFHGLSVLDSGAHRMSAYRFHVTDPILFRQSLLVTIEHGPSNNLSGDYVSTAFFYLDDAAGQTPADPQWSPLAEGSLVNGDFENGFGGYNGGEANGWLAYQSGTYFGYTACTFSASQSPVYSGANSQRIVVADPSNLPPQSAGITQQVPVTKGARYRATAHLYISLTGGAPAGTLRPRLGLGLAGSTYPFDSSIVWTEGPTTTGVWSTVTSPEVVAQADFMSLFADGLRWSSGGTATLWIDAVSFDRTSPPPSPVIVVQPAALNPVGRVLSSPPPDTITIRNAGSQTLNYQITGDADWLSVAPPSGSSAGEERTATVTYSTATLRAGVYQATLTVSSAEATNSPQHVAVNLTLQTVAPDFDGDGDVDQEDFGHLQACFTGPGVSQNDPACANTVLDVDTDVDQDDFTIFQRCMSGASVPADPSCAG